ncbi:MAG: hypothetical protein LBF37_00240 [Rickettsiales bacterium]|jgi:hypothetical protein|nr:hypothetical protein [Rickettsiales bacterium]
MKFDKIYSLTVAFTLSGAVFLAYIKPIPIKPSTPAMQKITETPVWKDIIFENDTNRITDKLCDDMTGKITNYVELPHPRPTLAGGLFFPYQNKIRLYHNITDSKRPDVQSYAQRQSTLLPLVK